MAFIESRLLDSVAYGTQGGPTWLTRRIELGSGFTRRNARRSRPRYRYLVLYDNLKPEHHTAVLNAFNACRGGLYAFRIKDWSDFAVDDQFLATGTGAAQEVQLFKLYEFGTENVERPIRKPVTGTVTLTADGAPLVATIDYTTGMASFTASDSAVVRWSGQFDVPVMFEQDELMFSAVNRTKHGLALTADIALIEDPSA